MRIQASHLNHSFMQKLEARQAQGKGLGEAESLLVQSAGERLGSGLSIASQPSASTSASGTYASVDSAWASLDASAQSARLAAGQLPAQSPETVGQTVANEIVRRMDVLTDENGEARDVSGLRDSLADALDWVREQYGDEAGAAAAGMLMSSTSGGVDEDAVGDGLLGTLKFIDRNFGVAAGDAAIAKFNSGVNRELNEYFDNGQNELFYVADSGASAETSGDISARFFARAMEQSSEEGGDAASVTEQLLEQLKADLDESAELTDLASQLKEAFSPASISMPRAMTAYLSDAVPAQPQLASMAV